MPAARVRGRKPEMQAFMLCSDTSTAARVRSLRDPAHAVVSRPESRTFDTVHRMEHPAVMRVSDHATWRDDKMGKNTLFESARMLVGLNTFEPGQSHALHAHPGMDKMYFVVEGDGFFLLDGRELPMAAGDLLVAPEGVKHGVRNPGPGRLLVLAVLAPFHA